MENYTGSIATDAAIGTILSNFSTEYIDHIIDNSLMMKFRPFDTPMPNMVDVLERQFLSIYDPALDYADKINEVRSETYKEIIIKICSFYNLSFVGDFENINITELYGIAHTLYDIFVSRFTDYMIDFLVSYIVNNADGISAYLNVDDASKKPKDSGVYSAKNYIDPKFILIHANVNQVIYNMAGYDIPLQQLLYYFLDPNTATRLLTLIVDNNDIYKTHYASYILDQRTTAGVLTNVKLKLQNRTQELISINTKKTKGE